MDVLGLLADSYPDQDALEPTVLRAAKNITASRAVALRLAHMMEHETK